MKPDQAAVLQELRREFDASFAQEPRVDKVKQEMLLAIRVGGHGYALRIDEIAGLYADRPITPIPTLQAELKGLAGFRGRVAPAYDLAGLLGYPIATEARWLVLARWPEPLALIFEAFEGHFTAAAGDIVRAPGTTLQVPPAQRPGIFDAVRYGAAMRPIIDLPSFITQRIVESGPTRSKSS